MEYFDDYTPEMLVYFHALSPALQQAVQQSTADPNSLESLAALAENLAQSGVSEPGRPSCRDCEQAIMPE